MIRIAVLLLACFLTTGCGSLKNPYVPPTEGPTAKIEFLNETNKRFGLATYDDPKECRGAKDLTVTPSGYFTTMPASQGRFDFVVPANQDLTLFIGIAVSTTETVEIKISGGSYTITSCSMTITFPVNSDAEYQVTSKYDEEIGICTTTINETSTGQSVPVKFRSRVTKETVLSSESAYCLDI